MIKAISQIVTYAVELGTRHVGQFREYPLHAVSEELLRCISAVPPCQVALDGLRIGGKQDHNRHARVGLIQTGKSGSVVQNPASNCVFKNVYRAGPSHPYGLHVEAGTYHPIRHRQTTPLSGGAL